MTKQDTSKAAQLDGYRAAGILIRQALDDADNVRPARWDRINRKSAHYRAGYYDAILAAHCWMVLGECPERNADTIQKALRP